MIIILSALFATSCRHTSSFQSSRFRPGFYVDVRVSSIQETGVPVSPHAGPDHDVLGPQTQDPVSLRDSFPGSIEKEFSGLGICSQTVSFAGSLRDTIPAEDEYQQKLTKKEKRALAIVISGSVIMFTGIALLVYVLLGLLTGLTFTPVFYYFSAGLILIGYLIRELGYSVRN